MTQGRRRSSASSLQSDISNNTHQSDDYGIHNLPEEQLKEKKPRKKKYNMTRKKNNNNNNNNKNRRKGSIIMGRNESMTTFPKRLLEIINEKSNHHIICWSEHGLSFQIKNQDLFISILLEKYFRHQKLTSFQRQLNLYGFRRITKGEDAGSYFHPQFRRDNQDLVAMIKRVPGKGSTSTAKYLPLFQSRHIPAIEDLEEFEKLNSDTFVDEESVDRDHENLSTSGYTDEDGNARDDKDQTNNNENKEEEEDYSSLILTEKENKENDTTPKKKKRQPYDNNINQVKPCI